MGIAHLAAAARRPRIVDQLSDAALRDLRDALKHNRTRPDKISRRVFIEHLRREHGVALGHDTFDKLVRSLGYLWSGVRVDR